MSKRLGVWDRYARAVGEEWARLATQELRDLASTLLYKRAKADYKAAIRPATFSIGKGTVTLRLSPSAKADKRVHIVEQGQAPWDMKKYPKFAGPFGAARKLGLEQQRGGFRNAVFSPYAKGWKHPGVEAKNFMGQVKAQAETLLWEAMERVMSGEADGTAARKYRAAQTEAKAAEAKARSSKRRK